MKKVIKNSVYDTETAAKVGEYDSGHQYNDFHYFEETLYRTKSGKYFLYCYGGANSRYGEWHGNTGSSGESIRAMPYNDATEWAQEHLSGDEYIKAFGEPEEGDKAQTAFWLSGAARKRLDIIRAETGESLSAIVERLIMGA